MKLIEVKNLTKEYKIFKRKKGFFNAIKSLVYRKYEIIKAVDDISFNINKGEIVGYIGPNGAGKSTTIKMLVGILVPTAGKIVINNIIPHKNRFQFTKRIGVVFGQRTHLQWDLPIIDSYDLYHKMYDIPDTLFKHNVKYFKELLKMSDFINKPVRQLSLGQKMRAELASAFLHNPDIIFLDEPTIGLDVVAKDKLRKFIKKINKETNVTVLITTHDMDDIEEICDRIIMIDKGKIINDSSLIDFKNHYGSECILMINTDSDNVSFKDPRLQLIEEKGNEKKIIFNKKDISVAEAVTIITHNFSLNDIKIIEADIESIAKQIYQKDK